MIAYPWNYCWISTSCVAFFSSIQFALWLAFEKVANHRNRTFLRFIFLYFIEEYCYIRICFCCALLSDSHLNLKHEVGSDLVGIEIRWSASFTPRPLYHNLNMYMESEWKWIILSVGWPFMKYVLLKIWWPFK